MFDSFKEHSIAEFFKKNKQMLGFSGKVRSLTTVVHEYITNSLDACEEHGILPNIKVEIKQEGNSYRVIVKDNGPGIPKHLIGKALGKMLAGTKFHRYMQQRGQQGIGAAGCTMFSYITTGQPIHFISAHNGKIVSGDLYIDFKTNEPIIKNLIEREGNFHGLTVEAVFKDVKYENSQYGVLEYIKRTALVNPHATIEFISPNNERFLFRRVLNTIPPLPKEVKPHPLGITTHQLFYWNREEALDYILLNYLSRFTKKKLDELKTLVPDVNLSSIKLSWKEIEKVVHAIKQIKWRAPHLTDVIPIGKERIEISLKHLYNPEYSIVIERPPKVYRGGIPFVVEVGLGYNINEKSSIMRFANRTPLLFDASGCAITETIKKINWKRYDLDLEKDNIIIFVNLSSVYIPYSSAGKQSISYEEEIVKEMKNAILDAMRYISKYKKKKIKVKEQQKRRQILLNYAEQLSNDLAYLSEKDKEEILKKLKEIIEGRYHE